MLLSISYLFIRASFKLMTFFLSCYEVLLNIHITILLKSDLFFFSGGGHDLLCCVKYTLFQLKYIVLDEVGQASLLSMYLINLSKSHFIRNCPKSKFLLKLLLLLNKTSEYFRMEECKINSDCLMGISKYLQCPSYKMIITYFQPYFCIFIYGAHTKINLENITSANISVP